MKVLRNLLFALIMVMALATSPVLALADNSELEIPDCAIDPEACQAMLERYANQYGPLLEESDPPTNESESSTDAESVEIENTSGIAPTVGVMVVIVDYEFQLEEITNFVCSDPELQHEIWFYSGSVISDVSLVRAFKNIALDHTEYGTIEAKYNSYLQDMSEEGFSVPVRSKTLYERAQEREGCIDGVE